MMNFIRKYQRYFYFVITAVTILSFSFFGTYGTIGASNIHEQTAFTAVDGTIVSRSELEELALFIATDTDDKRLYNAAWGPNFLNDGVIKKDFMMTGLAEILLNTYSKDFQSDLDIRLRKEKHYTPYTHPYANFLNAPAAWGHFAPYITQYLNELKQANNPTDPKTIRAKIALYLGQETFPAPMLQRVLVYQEKQYGWIPHDPSLDNADLFLFNYHSLDDWFGTRFTRLIAQFIINASKIAEQRGYVVTKEEALADLLLQSQKSFNEFSHHAQLGVNNAGEYFQEQLRRLGLDQTKAIKLWREVLLFRRLFQDLGSSVLVDPTTYQAFNAYALENVEGKMYRLPAELRFGDFASLQRFETYLSAISKRNDADPLAVPTTFLSASEVMKRNPELVQNKYVLEVAPVDKKFLETKVGIKEAWNWETSDANWMALRKQFPELGTKKAETREERLALLDSLDHVTRGKIDQTARSAIVDNHPEWLVEALDQAQFSKMDIGLRSKGGKFPLRGIQNREELLKQLNAAPINGSAFDYSGDKKSYYRIRVLERKPELEVLTFAEARTDGTLDEMLNQQLEPFYVKIRTESPEKYQKQDTSWKELHEVRDLVAEEYFANLLDDIRADEKSGKTLTSDVAASLRFNKMARLALASLKKGTQPSPWLQPENPGIADQLKFIQEDLKVGRGISEDRVNVTAIFKLKTDEWLSVQTPPNGDVYFFHQERTVQENNLELNAEQVAKARQLLNEDAQQMLMLNLLVGIQAKNAISFEYLTRGETQIEPEHEVPAPDYNL